MDRIDMTVFQWRAIEDYLDEVEMASSDTVRLSKGPALGRPGAVEARVLNGRMVVDEVTLDEWGK